MNEVMARGATTAFFLLAMGAGFVVAKSIDAPFETKLSVFLPIALAMIGYPGGWVLGYWLSRGSDVESKGFRIIAWSNLLAWLLPIVGMLLSAATWRFSRETATRTALYRTLSTVGFLLAAVNAGYGGVVSRGVMQSAPQREAAVVSTTERSWPRCQFAAIEQWSTEDFETYCRDHKPTAAEMREFERLVKEHEQQAKN